MIAFAIALSLLVVLAAVVYGRAIVYAHSDEYQLEQRIRGVAKR